MTSIIDALEDAYKYVGYESTPIYVSRVRQEEVLDNLERIIDAIRDGQLDGLELE